MKLLKKILRKLFYLILLIIVVLTILEFLPFGLKYDANNTWINTSNVPWIIPHGGAKEMYPENTALAFNGVSAYDAFEIDLTLTKDNELITHHNLALGFDLNVPDSELLTIRNLNYSEVLQTIIDADYPYARSFVDPDNLMPYQYETDQAILDQLLPVTLESLFIQYPNKKYILELKDKTTETEDTFSIASAVLLDLIETHNMKDNVLVSSFSDEVITYFMDLSNHEIHTSTASHETLMFVLYSAFNIDFFYKPAYAAMAIPIEDSLSSSNASLISKLPSFISSKIAIEENGTWVTNLAQKGLVDDAHRHNMSVIFWTVNDVDDMQKMIDLGVDGIITDRPDLLLQLYQTLGIV